MLRLFFALDFYCLQVWGMHELVLLLRRRLLARDDVKDYVHWVYATESRTITVGLAVFITVVLKFLSLL